jgi:Lrp/AsnC family transcriptional regulator, leucine-responsive regulatory protein
MSNLDKADRRIMFELDKNARARYSVLARQLKMPQETVRYRVQRLVEAGVIQKFFTVVDSAKLGFAFYKVLLKLHSATEDVVQESIAFLKQMTSLSWIVRLDGCYDIGFVVKVERVMALSAALDQVSAKLCNFIAKRSVSINILGEYLRRDYLTGAQRKAGKPALYSADALPYSLDPANRTIIGLLTQDARMSAAYIARTLVEQGKIHAPLSPEAVQARIKRLESDRVITGYNLVLNHAALGQIHYKVLIYLNPISPEKITAFVEHCRKQPNIVYIIKAVGEWDYELDIEVENVEQYRTIVAELIRHCPHTIKDYTGLIVTKIYQYNLFPE